MDYNKPSAGPDFGQIQCLTCITSPFQRSISCCHPQPEDHIFVRANGFTPYAGIWEPVAAPEQSFWRRLTGAWKPQPPFEMVGAMAYFHPHSKAPRIRIGSEDKCTKLNMAWRLLWRDDRYADGTVPEKEAQYSFFGARTFQTEVLGPTWNRKRHLGRKRCSSAGRR